MQEYQEDQLVEEVPVLRKTPIAKKFAGLLAVAILILGGWAYAQRSNLISVNTGSSKKLTGAEQKVLVANYLAQVGKHMLLPVNDEPVIATVDDPVALIKQQAFFTGSVKGDVVLIFPKTQRAVLYSPSRNKIVNAGPIITGNKDTQQNISASTTPPLPQ